MQFSQLLAGRFVRLAGDLKSESVLKCLERLDPFFVRQLMVLDFRRESEIR
jgi:hypothetical protein